MSDNFYRAFEERYRGSSELIITRLRAYLPFILPLTKIYLTAPAIDLGCGRGEWLELLLQEGFLPQGIDQDEEMLQGCIDRNLPAMKGDAIEFLSQLPDESQAIVSAFHVVEHISFEQLRTLVLEAHRVLKPGGLLILETPNPENIAVATRNFYLDPTHQRPIPPLLLSFVPEYYGFFRTKVMRLQESKELVKKISPNLNDVIEGVSPDYAVIAQKTASIEVLDVFDHAFTQEYGLKLSILAERYDTAILHEIEKVDMKAQKIDNIENKLDHLVKLNEDDIQSLKEKVNKLQNEVVKFESTEQELRSQITYWHQRVIDLHQSLSWKITRPLRLIKKIITGEIFEVNNRIKLFNSIKNTLKKSIRKSVNFLSRRPRLKRNIIKIISKFPRLHSYLAQLVAKSKLTLVSAERRDHNSNEIILLTPFESEIHEKLKKVIDN
ncbi:class I SAM-dependent methyltransferase [Acinetobacter sp. ANC 4633]|uniref:class I SAM-dependent methyltransferase n=1 Tax=Acinetobacter sp. ANC 4633 TaxID=2529845 RepID=UPI00103D6940|nr:class I SAM-dependent methyltransferase [Acinetobacter sp. ANC 4633]TCB27197.1 class I SAM-dependent methyltransferase [Acinetobacter sp. ANC 4633]